MEKENMEDIKKRLENELREYIQDPSSAKEYTQHIQEFDQWLKGLDK